MLTGANIRPIAATIVIERDVAMKNRDGTVLRADVYRPDITARVPAIVLRTPYDKSSRRPGLLGPLEAAAAGFAFVIQDVRGRFTSEGEWNAIDWGGVERPDGADCIEWVASESWCDGNVGMIGASYCAGNQIAAAREQPSGLRCIAPSAVGCGYDGIRQSQMTLETIIVGWTAMMAVDVIQKRMAAGEDVGDDLQKVMAVAADLPAACRTLPLKDLAPLQIEGMPSFTEMLGILERAAHGFFGEEERIEVPALVNGGWYDIGAGFELFHLLREQTGTDRARRETKTIVGPWGHNGHEWNIGEWGHGQFASVQGAAVPASHLAFYSRHLRGDDSAPELPNVRYFVMGANQWRDADDWPIPGTESRRLYLHSRGAANTAAGDGALTEDAPAATEAPDRYRYDPADPAPSFGLRVMYNGGSTVHGPFDQNRLEQRPDVLVYTSAPFQEATEVSGDVELVVSVSSSAPETDFFAKLCVVSPDGVSCNLADAALRTRYLNGWDDVAVLERDHIYELHIRLGPTAYRFPPGSRARLQITSSSFPHWDRNMNTGHPPGEDAEGVVAEQTVHHSDAHPSYLVLPVADAAASRPSVLPAGGVP